MISKLKANAVLFLQRRFGRLVRLLLGPHVTALVVRSPHGLFAVDPEDNGVGGHLRRRGSYAGGELERIAALTDSGSRVLVVGSHVGTLAIPIALRVASVTAVEANPATQKLLKMNIALNGVVNCEVLHTAVSDRSEVIEFQLGRNNSGNSKRRPLEPGYLDSYDRPSIVKVQAERLDDLLPGARFDLIIMDIEGSEYLALKGMPGILDRSSALIVEFMPQAIKSVTNVTIDEFVGVIEPYFSRLFIPSRGLRVERARFREVLGEMYARGESDAGILFQKD